MAKTFLQVRTDERDKRAGQRDFRAAWNESVLCSEYAVETDYYDEEYSV